ncbi:MAG: ABC transporter substrate-binding protein [Alkalispirochaeta sp.]
MKHILTVLMIIVTAGTVFSAGSQEGDVQTVVFADNNYESIQIHNRIAAFILENGYGGIEADYIPGDTIPLINGLAAGDIDVYMESWHENFQEVYDEFTESGEIVNIGRNMPPGPQGWYVPRYVIEGDPDRGIEAVAPDLTSIADLPKHWELFQDPENPDRGRIIVGPPGWKATEMSQEMMEENGLYDTYTDVLPGSGTALAASMTSAYERGNPWVGYHWEPTAIIGRLDMVMLEGSEFPPTSVDILVNGNFSEDHPEIVAFLERYETSLEQNNELLAHMEDEGLDFQETAEYFLQEHEATWTAWVNEDVADRVRAALQ